MQPSAPARKQRPGVSQQRKDIVVAAIELFAASGSAAVSVSAICKQANVSRDTFYRYFDNKDHLIDALYRYSVSNNMLAVTSAADADFADPDWLHRTIDTTVDAILTQHQVARFLFLEAADPGSHAHGVIASAFDRVARSMQAWCRNHSRSQRSFSPVRSTSSSLEAMRSSCNA